MNKSVVKVFAAVAAVCLIGASTNALSADVVRPTAQPKTMLEWVKAHPNATVEYRYSHPLKTNLLADAGDDIAELRNGTPVVIRLTDTVSSNSAAAGTNIGFQVVGDVKIGGKTLIRAGELGTAQVTAVEENGIMGKAGKIVVSDFSTRAVDGSFVPLRATLSDRGTEKMAASLVVSYLFCPLFILMKGSEAEIPAGTEKTVYVSADVDVAI